MHTKYPLGRVLDGDTAEIGRCRDRFFAQPVNRTWLAGDLACPYRPERCTLGGAQSVSGQGTFVGKARRTLTFMPSERPGWWIERADLRESLPIEVSVRNVWTTVRNIVLRSGSPHNYLRMVEHIVALRLGMGVDDVCVATDSGDPPLFDRGSLDLVEAIDRAGIVPGTEPAPYVTVREPVTIGGCRGDFITLLPAEAGKRGLRMDCAVDFSSVMGQQRIVFDLTPETFRYGAEARTNASRSQMVMVKLFGWLFADMRNLGYSYRNILIHGRRRYYNQPRLHFSGLALEAVWHRSALDLLAALALIDTGRFAGTVVSFRAGHTLDVRLVTMLYRLNLLQRLDA